jgi:hypothetical protein
MNGPEIPYRRRLIANANEMVDRSQPKSVSKGTMNTPDEERTIPAVMIEKNTINKITQL